MRQVIRGKKMNIKHELIINHIAEAVKEVIEGKITEELPSANTKALEILEEIKKIIRDDTLTDFEVVEEIVCIFERNGIDCDSRHDF